MNRKLVSSLASGWMTALLGGCAVLTVDVDVYKGSMANEDSIRIEQLAATAVSATPILHELRYRSERAACKPEPYRLLTIDMKDKEIDNCLREAGFRERQSIDILNPKLKSLYAQKIDAILSLYQDTSSLIITETDNADVDMLISTLSSAIAEMRRAQHKTDGAFANKTLGKFISGADRIKIGDAICAGKETGGPSAPAWLTINSKNSKSYKELEAQWDTAKPGAVFPGKVLLEGQESVCNIFKRIYDLRHLNRTGYFVVLQVVKPTCDGPDDSSLGSILCAINRTISKNHAVWNAAIKIIQDGTAPDNVRLASARIAAGLLSPSVIRNTGYLLADSGEYPLLRTLYMKLYGHLRTEESIPVEKYSKYRKAIADELILGGQGKFGLATELMKFNDRVMADTNDSIGILTYPLPDPSVPTTVAGNLTEELGDFAASLTGVFGLDRGRPPNGLHTLIENYLKASEFNAENSRVDLKPDNVQRAKHELLVGLVHFAQKLLTLADHDILLRDQADPFTNDEESKKFVRVLQAMGNGMLSNVDDLARSGHFQDKLARRWPADKQAAEESKRMPILAQLDKFKEAIGEAALDPDNPQEKTLADSVQTFQGESEALTGQLHKVLQDRRKANDPGEAADAVKATLQSLAKRSDVKDDGNSVWLEDAIAQFVSILERDAAGLNAPPAIDQLERWKSNWSETTCSGDKPAGEHLACLIGIALDAGSTEENKKKRQQLAALERASAMAPSLPAKIPFNPVLENANSATDLLENMQTQLRHLHIQAVAQFGQTLHSNNIKRAEELIARYRSGLIHIRSATSYLRNSYAVSGNSSGYFGQNLLKPTFGVGGLSFITSDKEERKRERIVDQQFWQSVNRIRVGGVGDTNYAVTKDDIGNWYVKGYSSDSKDIAKSMKNLALFSLSSGTRRKVPGIVDDQKTGPESGATDKGKAEQKDKTGAASPAYERFVAKYAEESEKIFRAAQDDAVKHHDTLQNAVKLAGNAPPDCVGEIFKESILKDAIKPPSLLDKSSKPKNSDGKEKTTAAREDYNAWTLDLLGKLHSYAKGRVAELNKRMNNDDNKCNVTPPELPAKYRAAIWGADKAVREQHLSKRIQSIDHQRTVMEVLTLPSP